MTDIQKGSMYLVIGCDDFGFSVADTLRKRGIKTVVVEENKTRVEHLRNLGYRENEVILGNPSSPDVLEQAGFERAEVVLILLSEYPKTEKVLQTINRLKGRFRADPVVVARALEESFVADARALGASDILPINQLLTASAVNRLEELKLMTNEKRLRRLFERERARGGKLAVILQTNPDPDSIASGVALKLYARAHGVDADIIYDGIIGHRQNRALVNLLELRMLEASDIRFDDYRWFALVDVATRAHCALPPGMIPTIVIDHHAVPASEVEARVKDITPVAATSTILTNYLKFAGVRIDRPTATALLLGIFTDTMRFLRGFTPLDLQAFEYLWELADRDLLRKLFSPTVALESLDIFVRAVKASKIVEGYLFANVGEVEDRDIIADASDWDFLLNREGVTTTFVYGIVGKNIYISARTKDVSLHLGKSLREAFSDLGSAGGHASMAGATIPISALKTTKRNLKRKMDRVLRAKFLEAVGVLRPRKRRRKSPKK